MAAYSEGSAIGYTNGEVGEDGEEAVRGRGTEGEVV